MLFDGTTSKPHFGLPLSRSQFSLALRSGHGRVVLHTLAHGCIGLEDLILDACFEDKRYDSQCEPDRGAWLAALLKLGDLTNEFLRRVRTMQPLPSARNFWDSSQLCGILLALAAERSEDARTLLYSQFRRADDCANIFALEEIIELDGTQGLLFVAERLGEWAADHRATRYDDECLELYDSTCSQGEATRVLKEASRKNESIKRYLALVGGSQDDGASPTSQSASDSLPSRGESNFRVIGPLREDASVEQVIADIEGAEPDDDLRWPASWKYLHWGRSADPENLISVAHHLYRETDSGRIFRYLRVFERAVLPAFDVRLLSYAHSSDPEVRSAAFQALAHYRSRRVRNLGFQFFDVGNFEDGSLKLLRENYEPGDWGLIRRGVFRATEAGDPHHIHRDLIDIIERSLTDVAEPMLLVYERSLCGDCRRRALDLLLRFEVAPSWVLEEARHDASEEIRASVRNLENQP